MVDVNLRADLYCQCINTAIEMKIIDFLLILGALSALIRPEYPQKSRLAPVYIGKEAFPDFLTGQNRIVTDYKAPVYFSLFGIIGVR